MKKVLIVDDAVFMCMAIKNILENNGIEALKKIKADDAIQKVIMITAMGQEPMVKEAIL